MPESESESCGASSALYYEVLNKSRYKVLIAFRLESLSPSRTLLLSPIAGFGVSDM